MKINDTVKICGNLLTIFYSQDKGHRMVLAEILKNLLIQKKKKKN